VIVAWFGFFVVISVTLLLWLNAREDAIDKAKNRFEISVDETVHEIRARMHSYETMLQSSAALLNTVERMNRQKWNIYISTLNLAEHYPGVQGVGFSKVILPEQLAEHTVCMRAEGCPDYRVYPSGKREEYHSIIYLEPLDERNRRAIGYDMFSHPVRQEAMIRARDTAQTALSGKVRLIQEQVNDVQAGFLMYVPFYHTRGELLSLAQRKEKLEGFVYAPFRAKDLILEVLASKDPHIAVKIYEGRFVQDENLLYESERPSGSTVDEKSLFKKVVSLEMYGRTWTVIFQTLPSFESATDQEHSRIILLAGLPISFLVLLVLLSFSRTTQQAQTMARTMTAEIRELNNELENMINTAPNPIIVHTEEGAIIKINQTWIDLCGYTYEETPTTDIWVDKVYKENQEVVKAHIRNLFTITQKVDEGEFSFYSKSGSKITWQFSSAPFGIINGKKAVISSAMDVTELKNKDDLMMMQSRHAAMGEMINMIAHQWRQPLASISAVSGLLSFEVMMDQYDKEHFSEKLDLISDMALDLSDTINDFRNFFKEDKRKELSTWKELLDECLMIINPLLISKRVTVDTTFKNDDPFMTYPREMRQVILNLLKNADDALHDTSAAEPTIWIRVFCAENMSYFEIEDNGGGIPEAIIDKIFDPYFSTKMDKNGTGIGLYMSKTIVEKHAHGSLIAYNTEFGACFKIMFPVYG
jgi:PAS domain S-box-containing protein